MAALKTNIVLNGSQLGMKIDQIRFPDELMRSMRDKTCVVFAGAGVSMGEPAKLPSFFKLAEQLAAGTGETRGDGEPVDRFLGRIHRKGVRIHERSCTALNPVAGSHTPLHRDLLRLFPETTDIKVVTTNFDTLFEEACAEITDDIVSVYRAPALPLGHDFSGIVHVHGSREFSKGIVLTDSDFGRAYLTEGWARRFLVDLFQNYSVLFIGYSHDDVVMDYLARALPSRDGNRYVLIAEGSDESDWKARGITPIWFPKPAPSDYSFLNSGIAKLADYLNRTQLDWKQELTALASSPPPQDEESEHQILDAVRNRNTIRFFTNVAKDKSWPAWLDGKGALDDLFAGNILTEEQRILAAWISEHYTHEYPEEVILIVGKHGLRLNSLFWWILGREIGLAKDGENTPDSAISLSRWVTLLIATAPPHGDTTILEWLAERCARYDLDKELLQLFSKMAEPQLQIKKGINWYDENDEREDKTNLDINYQLFADHWHLNEFYQKYLKSHLERISTEIFELAISTLSTIHSHLAAWDRANEKSDTLSYMRSAIEPHEQDDLHHREDVLIDAARDAWEQLAISQPGYAHSLFLRHARSEAPIIRRLCVHYLTQRADVDANEKLQIFLQHFNLHDIATHHETYQFGAHIYGLLTPTSRVELLDEVLKYRWPLDDGEAEHHAAREKYSWLEWLKRSDPSCELLNESISRLTSEFPDLQSREHPDLTHWHSGAEWVGHKSPYSAGELLTKSPNDWLETLQGFKGDEFRGPDVRGLQGAITEAARTNAPWGFELAEALAKTGAWDSDFWAALIDAWKEWPDNEEQCQRILFWLKDQRLYPRATYDISRALLILVEKEGKTSALSCLDDTNRIAKGLWAHVTVEDFPEAKEDWLGFAINNSAGVLAQYWLHALSLWWKAQEKKPSSIPDAFRLPIESIIQEGSSASGVALAVFASQFPYFLSIDEDWTKEQLLPWFEHEKDPTRMQQSWDGFLTWGSLNPRVFDALAPMFLKACSQLGNQLASHRDRFAEFFVVMVMYYAKKPLDEAIPTFFLNGDETDRRNFAFSVDRMLRGLNEEQQKEQWDKWLRAYWNNRLQGIPAVLDEVETNEMLEWTTQLTAVYGEAVNIAVQMPPTPFKHLSIGYDLKNSDLPERFPYAVAKLLIYIMESGADPQVFYGFKEIIQRIPQEGIDPGFWNKVQGLSEGLGLA